MNVSIFRPGWAGGWRGLLGLLLGLWLLAGTAWAQGHDQVRIGVQLEPPLLDPTVTAAATAGEITYVNIFEGLTVLDGEGQLKPRLATSWSVSPDGLTYDFTLRSGVRFHDGKPFNAQTAAFALERIVAPDSKNPQRAWYEKIKSVQALGPDRLRVQLHQPDALLTYALALPAAAMVHPDTALTNGERPIGTGPFRLDQWNRTRWVQLSRNDDYWGKAPALSKARFIFLHTSFDASNMLAEGMIDGMVSVTRMTDQFKQRPDYRTQSRSIESKLILAINNARPPFNDLRVRRALAHAIDREKFAKIYGPQYPTELIGSHFSPTHPAYVNLAGQYAYDPARARALLKEAKVKPKTPVTLVVPPTDYGRYGGLQVASDLEAVGFRVELQELPWKDWMRDVFTRKDYALSLIMHVEALDLNIYARDIYYFNYDNAAFKEIWKQVLAAPNQAELYRLLGLAQRKIADDAVNVFLFYRPELNFMHRDLVGMWEKSPVPSFVLQDLRWKR